MGFSLLQDRKGQLASRVHKGVDTITVCCRGCAWWSKHYDCPCLDCGNFPFQVVAKWVTLVLCIPEDIGVPTEEKTGNGPTHCCTGDCASQKISGYRQKKYREWPYSLLHRLRLKIYVPCAFIGRLGMQKANNSGGDLFRKKPLKYQSKTTRPKAVTKLVRTLESSTYGSRNRINIWC